MSANKVHRWCLVKDGTSYRIRRWNNTKYESVPSEQYAHFKHDLEELKAFVARLNHRFDEEERAKTAVQFKHAFISPALMDDYRTFLLAQITHERALTEYRRVVDHVLNFFIGKHNLADPLEWHKIHQTEWTDYLKSLPLAPTTVRDIVQGANRFLAWLHRRRPDVAPSLRLTPLTAAAYKAMAARYKLETKKEPRKFIPAQEWRALRKQLPESIKAVACLCYYYGLRRAEALGLSHEHIFEDFLKIERQYVGKGKYEPPKDREARETPHWFLKPAATYELISKIQLIHPDSFGDLFAEATGGKYTLHDLRHTFITRAIRKKGVHPRDVMLAVGHADLQTTMGYLKDDRQHKKTPFVPKRRAA